MDCRVSLNFLKGCHPEGMDIKNIMNNILHISIVSGAQEYSFNIHYQSCNIINILVVLVHSVIFCDPASLHFFG